MISQTDNVIAFPGVRQPVEAATVVIGASLAEEPISVRRLFGVNDRMDLGELSQHLAIIFGWGGSAPTTFTLGPRSSDAQVPMATTVGDILQAPGDQLHWHWGLWTHILVVEEAFARVDSTPEVLCLGGSGMVHFLGQAAAEPYIDIAAINRELTGRDHIEQTLAATRADIAQLIRRADMFEFVPLLQALDVGRPEDTSSSQATVARLRTLAQQEADPAGADAAHALLLGLATLAPQPLRQEVQAHVMARLGWHGDDGLELSGAEVEELAPLTWAEMQAIGLAGAHALNPVGRLELLRETLRR